MTTPEREPCPRCNRIHERCAGHSKTHGGPCGRRPVPGAAVCTTHGGKAPQVQRAAAARVDRTAALKEAGMLVQSRDIDPITALLETVQFTAGEVDYWRSKVALLDEDTVAGMLTTKTETGVEKGQDTNLVTTESTEHLYVRLLHDATDRLAKYASLAVRAGCDQKRVEIAEAQGAAVAAAQRRILTRMLDAVVGLLRDRGVADDEIMAALQAAWDSAITVVVPEELRRLATGESA